MFPSLAVWRRRERGEAPAFFKDVVHRAIRAICYVLETRCLLVASQESQDSANLHEFRFIFFNSSYFSIPAYFTLLPSCCFSVFFSKERSEFYYILFSSYTCFPLFSFLFLSNPLLSCLSSVVLQWYFKPGILSIYTKLLIIFLSNLISFFLFRDSSDSQPYNS